MRKHRRRISLRSYSPRPGKRQRESQRKSAEPPHIHRWKRNRHSRTLQRRRTAEHLLKNSTGGSEESAIVTVFNTRIAICGSALLAIAFHRSLGLADVKPQAKR